MLLVRQIHFIGDIFRIVFSCSPLSSHTFYLIPTNHFSLNVNTQSKKNRTPFIMDTAPLRIAKSLVRVRKECCHASIIKTPDTTNSALPMKLKNISCRLLNVAFIMYPKRANKKVLIRFFS